MFSVDRAELRAFVRQALTRNHTYHVVRRELADTYHALLQVEGGVLIPPQLHVQIRTYLVSRSEALDNTAKYAFENAIIRLLELASADRAPVGSE